MNIPKEAWPNARAVEKYLESLACPHCKDNMARSGPSRLTCCGCQRTFEVVGGIPILLPVSLLKGQEWQKWNQLEDEYESFYRCWSKESHLAARAIYDAFYDWCGVRESREVSVLDVGGANGIHRLIYWKYPEKVDYFSLDPRIHFLHPYHWELYPKNRQLDFPYVVGVGEYLPFKAKTFDICVTTAAIDHCNNPVGVFQEVHRCLKPDRSLYVMVRKHGAPSGTEFTGWLIPRISQYYREHGLVATGEKMARQVSVLPRLFEHRKKDRHIHHFTCLRELTELLFMFRVARTKKITVAGRTLFFVECRKE